MEIKVSNASEKFDNISFSNEIIDESIDESARHF